MAQRVAVALRLQQLRLTEKSYRSFQRARVVSDAHPCPVYWHPIPNHVGALIPAFPNTPFQSRDQGTVLVIMNAIDSNLRALLVAETIGGNGRGEDLREYESRIQFGEWPFSLAVSLPNIGKYCYNSVHHSYSVSFTDDMPDLHGTPTLFARTFDLTFGSGINDDFEC
ncbi:unnamed protein product [Caenorhabditis auriculariae]|uniref:Uncharacterized protein n=1 Tax=Caenorhabditis auriculariae TaxID=2777116 RepID=A0A8S1H6X1_9PELO|nr:unnamed protein product [Caenorhabditis auriculariae]